MAITVRELVLQLSALKNQDALVKAPIPLYDRNFMMHNGHAMLQLSDIIDEKTGQPIEIVEIIGN